jgi:O-antigen/teichoic acid export membrane protein
LNRSLSRRTVGNIAGLAAGAAAETLLSFVFVLVISRTLGPEEFGFYGYIVSLSALAVTIASFGLPVLAVREMAQRPHDETAIFSASVRIRAVWAILFFVGAIIVSIFSDMSAVHRAAVWLLFAYLLFVPLDLSLLFDARKLSRWDAPGRVAGRVVSLVLLLVLWQLRGDLTVADAALCTTVVIAANVAVAWQINRRRGQSLRLFAPTTEVRSLWSAALPIAWANVATVIYQQSLTVIVKWLSTALETGYFALANRLFVPFLMLRGTLYRVLLPLVSEVAHDRARMTERLEKALPALALLFIPLTALAIPAADVLLVPVFGANYAQAVVPFQIGIAVLALSGMGSLFGTSVLAAGDAMTPTVGLTIGCAVSLGVSTLLVPHSGAVGAAIAGTVGETVSVLYPLPKFLKEWQPRVISKLVRISLPSLLCPLTFYLLRAITSVSLVVALLAAVILMLAALWVAQAFSLSEIQSLYALLKKPNEVER